MDEEIKQLSESGLQFALDLFQELRKQPKPNILISPVSLVVALSVIYAGSKTVTKAELKKVLHLEKFHEDSEVHAIMGKLVEFLENITERGLELYLATRFLVKAGTPIVEEFQKILRTNYHFDIQEVTFDEETRKAINAWIENKTDNKIRHAISEQGFDEAMQMLLINAVYFKSEWDQPFDRKNTQRADFHLDSKSKVTVDMMFRVGDFYFSSSDEMKCTLLGMTYAEEKICMYVILPHETEGLSQLESVLNAQNLLALIASSANKKFMVSVAMPKFRMELSLFLEDILPNIGLITLFRGLEADLSGISGQKQFFVSHFFHRTLIDVNEEGKEANKVTSMFINFGPLLSIAVNHPFLFLIQDKRTDSILFLGRVLNPVA